MTNTTPTAQPGWFPDPWQPGNWRWWDGQNWTPSVASGEERKPRLPAWLSVPLVIGAIVAIPFSIYLAYQRPTAVLLGFVPLLIVLPTMAWLDRVEPEPRSSRIHALLWGALVATSISGIVNTIVVGFAGETITAVVSAPLIEELSKGLGIYWAVRRQEVDGPMDGIVYAGWVALGFAVTEDFQYFATASEAGNLAQVFILRAILTPFAHPLFTAWTGLSIGLAIHRSQSILVNSIWGFGFAVASHAAWNGAATYADETQDMVVLGLAMLGFVGLFVASVITVVVMRRQRTKRFVQLMPFLVERYHLPQSEATPFTQWKQLLRERRKLSRSDRPRFDAMHSALARLVILHSRPGTIKKADEDRLVQQLHKARRDLSTAQYK